jgi:hypothetical protein
MAPSSDSSPRSRFDELCKCLERNDPNVVDVNLTADDGPLDCGPRLGAALQNNTVVTTLSLLLSRLLSGKKQNGPEEMMKSVALLLQFLQTSLSLQTVALFFYRDSDALAEMILNAMIRNSVIKALKWNAKDFHSLPLLTNFLLAKATSLTKLDVYYSYDPMAEIDYELMAGSVRRTLGGNVGPPEEALLPEVATMEAAAQAVAALFPLESLTLHLGLNVELFMLPLVGHHALCTLTVQWVRRDYDCNYTEGMNALFQVLSTCANLQHVILMQWVFVQDEWRTLVQGVQGRVFQQILPLDKLVLRHCYFGANVACTMFARDMASGQGAGVVDPQAAYPCSVATLKLVNCTFATGNQHELNMTAFLSTTVRLHTLELSWMTFPMPRHFIAALRENGSLTSVKINDGGNHTPGGAVGRYISAITTRNQMVPQLLTNASFCQSPIPHLSLLLAVAKQAPQMAANTLFLSLLASRGGMGPL